MEVVRKIDNVDVEANDAPVAMHRVVITDCGQLGRWVGMVKQQDNDDDVSSSISSTTTSSSNSDVVTCSKK